jgi:hypothetical protein
LFIGARYKDQIHLSDALLEMDTTLRLTDDEKTQFTLSSSLTHEIGKRWLQFLYAEAQYLSDAEYQKIVLGNKLRHKLNSGQALSMGLSTYATTEEGFQAEKYLVTLSHRLKLYSSWIFLNSELFLDWQKAHSFSSNPGIQLGLNIYFGK